MSGTKVAPEEADLEMAIALQRVECTSAGISDGSFSLSSSLHEWKKRCERRVVQNSSLASGSAEDAQLDMERRFVLFGRTGSGKSETGNTILGRQGFKASIGAGSMTSRCELLHARRLDFDLLVCDTPGFFDTRIPNSKLANEVLKVAGIMAPGPHAVIIVIPVTERYTTEHEQTVENLVDIFGVNILNFTILVFTKVDCIQTGLSLEQYLEHPPKALELLLKNCKRRYLGVNNLGSDEEKVEFIENLIDLTKTMLFENNSPFCQNKVFTLVNECFMNGDGGRENLPPGTDKSGCSRDKFRENIVNEKAEVYDSYITMMYNLMQQYSPQIQKFLLDLGVLCVDKLFEKIHM